MLLFSNSSVELHTNEWRKRQRGGKTEIEGERERQTDARVKIETNLERIRAGKGKEIELDKEMGREEGAFTVRVEEDNQEIVHNRIGRE